MAKRKRGVAEDLFEIAAMLPWWVGVGLAIAAYVILHVVATSQMTSAAPVQPGQMGQIMVQSIFKGFATIGQYILPIIFLSGAVASPTRAKLGTPGCSRYWCVSGLRLRTNGGFLPRAIDRVRPGAVGHISRR